MLISALSVLVVMGALGFGRFGYTMILPSMQQGLELSNAQVGDLAAANMTGYLLLSVLGGLLASRFGARGVIWFSLLIVAASMALTGLASTYRWALAGRFLTGVGSGGSNVPIMGLLVAWYSKEKRGFAAGIAVSGSSFGLLVTGITIPLILQRYATEGWRASWIYLAILTGLIAFVSALLLRDAPEDSVGRQPGHRQMRSRIAGAGSADFRRLFRSGRLWLLSAIYIAFGFSYVIYATFFARGLISADFTGKAAGELWSAVGAASIASGFIWGIVSDRIGRRFSLALIYLLQASSFLIFGLCLLGESARIGFFVSAGLFALTAWSIPAVMSAAAGDLMGPKLASAGFGIITLFFGFGQVFGPFVAGRLAESAGGYGPSFVLAAGVAAAGALLSAVLVPSRLMSDTESETSSAHDQVDE